SNHLPGRPFGFATAAALRGSVDFANVDRPPAAVAGDVDIEAGHWFPPRLTEALPPGTSLSVDDEMPSLLTRTRSATRRFKWTVPAGQRAWGWMSGRACARTRALTCRPAPWIAAPS